MKTVKKLVKYAKSEAVWSKEENCKEGLIVWQYVGADIQREFPEATYEEIEDALDELIDYYGYEGPVGSCE